MADEDWDEEIGGYFDRITTALDGQDLRLKFVDVWVATTAHYAVVSLLVLITAGAYVAAWNSELNGFWNLLALSFSSSVFFFLLGPPVLRLGARNLRWVCLGGCVGSLLLLVLAWYSRRWLPSWSTSSADFVQATLIAAAVGVFTLAVFNVALASGLAALSNKRRLAREESARTSHASASAL